MSISKVNVSGADYQIVGSPRYATCSTAAATAAKVATIADGSSTFVLEKGARICVSFTYANTASAATLNVASTGAKAICWQGSALVSSQYWQAGAVVDFVYDGNGWSIVGVAKDNNSTNFLPLSGGSLTGNLTVGSSSIGTNGYIEGTWLKTTKVTESAGDFATISGDGWIYKRKPANVLGDIGGQAKITANGLLKGDGNGGVTAAVKGTDYDTEIVYVNYTGDTPTKDNITNMTEVVEAYSAGKVIAIKAIANRESSIAAKVPFFLAKALNQDGAIYVFYFIADYVTSISDTEAISCPYCIKIQCSQTQTNNGFVYTVSDVTDYGLTKAFPALHAYTHKTGGDDAITPESIGAQPKITANGFLTSDGEGNVGAEKPVLTVSVWLTGAPTRDETTGEYIYNFASEYNYEQITSALNHGYMVVVYYGGNIFYYTEKSSSNELIFSNMGKKYSTCIYGRLRCTSDDKWYQESNTLVSEEGVFPSANGRFTLSEIIQNLQTSVQEIAPYTKLCSASVPTANWQGSNPYTQPISCGYDVTRSTIANIQLSDVLYDQLVADGVTYLNIENTNGALFIKAKGGKPSVDLTLQITCTETRN